MVDKKQFSNTKSIVKVETGIGDCNTYFVSPLLKNCRE